MRISYNKLWKLLIVLLKICETLGCHIEDILETIDDQEEK